MTNFETIAPVDLKEITPLHLIYFGLFFFSVGVVIFQFLCPEVVKRYDGHISYIVEVAPNLSDLEYKHILGKSIESSFMVKESRDRAVLLLSSISLSSSITWENKVFALTEFYRSLNKGGYAGRLISSIFLAAGTILILLPTLMTFCSIVGSLVASIPFTT